MGLASLISSFTPQGAAAEVAKGAAEGLLAGAGQLAKDIRGVITGELPPEARAELEKLALRAEIVQTQAQNAVNEAEARSGSLFIGGWRPYIGWVCGTALLYHFLMQPWAAFVIALYKWQAPPLPTFDMGSLMTILLGMLGLGTMRTYEKTKGVAKP
jgi:hypothetical protein